MICGTKEYLKSFSEEEFSKHLERLQAEMKSANIDILLLSSTENIYYATGYRSWYLSSLFRPVFCIVPIEGEPALIFRYLEKTTVQNTSWVNRLYYSGSSSRNYGIMTCSGTIDGVKRAIRDSKIPAQIIGVEAGEGQNFQWSLALLKEIIDELDQYQFVDGSVAIQKARMVKTNWEISRIEIAGYITERAIVDTFKETKPGYSTEKDIASGIASRMCANGIDKISYLTINSGNDKYSTFNSYATNRIVLPGELILVDISGHFDGYASDLTRTFFLGKNPPTLYEDMARVAMDCVHAGFRALKAGIEVSAINAVIENHIKESKFGDFLVHSSGHSTGLNVVEYPILEENGTELTRNGMVFALENGIYPYDLEKGAESIYLSFRMEDEAVIEEAGPRWLSGPGNMIYTTEDFN